MSSFYLRHEGQTIGPIDMAEVRRRVSAGELPLGAMSWRIGEQRWVSLARRWSVDRGAHSVLDACAMLLVLAAWTVMLGLPGRLYPYLPDTLQTMLFLIAAVAVGTACAVTVTVRLARRQWRQRHRLSLSSAMCVTLTLVVAVISVSLCRQTLGLLLIEDKMPDATVSYDAGLHAVQLRGRIGHRFDHHLVAALRAHPDARMVTVSSPGGLVEEAFKAADIIAKARLPLRIDGECASACSLMWAAVPQREMTIESHIGLHQNRLLGDLPVQMTWRTRRDMERQSTDALISAGFTRDMLQHRAETPPGRMYWLDAVDILEAGVDAKVWDAAQKPASLPAAKWAVIAWAWGKDNPVRQFYLAVGAHEPEIAASYENRLYSALHQKQYALFVSQDRLFEAAALRQALREAPDQAVLDWARSREEDLADASQSLDDAACNVLTGRAVNGPLDTRTRERLRTHSFHRGAALIDAMAAPAGQVFPMHGAPYAAFDVASYSRSVVGKLRGQGFPADIRQWTDRQQCIYSREFLHGIQAMPPAHAAEIVRYSEMGVGSQHT